MTIETPLAETPETNPPISRNIATPLKDKIAVNDRILGKPL